MIRYFRVTPYSIVYHMYIGVAKIVAGKVVRKLGRVVFGDVFVRCSERLVKLGKKSRILQADGQTVELGKIPHLPRR